MGQFADIVSKVININYIKTAQASDIVDILLVAVLIYVAIGLIRKTNMTRVARGIVLIIRIVQHLKSFSTWMGKEA